MNYIILVVFVHIEKLPAQFEEIESGLQSSRLECYWSYKNSVETAKSNK
jgi:hypothetical protein